ncbi:hypothetical protein BGZ54_000666 [Gamsiella multidivaricata]|nr:hypothetical protein BGZ54_000666 [Gamsiella multidivaricata]
MPTTFGSKPLAPIHVLTPTTIQKNALLVMGAVYPSIFGAGLGIASGVLRDHGHLDASRIFMLCQYGNWVLILYIMAAMFFYYGLKYTFILRANIIIAEAALKAPRAAFGIGNLKSRSPARFLFIQLQITGFGGCAVTILAGSLCLIWILFQQKILAMEDDQLPHTMAFFWTCAMAATFFVINSLITAQSVRNRKRGLHDPSSSLSGPSSGQGSGGNGTGSLQKHGGPNQNQSYNSKGSKHVMSRFDPEVCLTHESSGDVSTLHSVLSIEKSGADQTRDMNDSDLEAEGIECDHDSLRAYSLPPPPRPVIGSSSFKAASTGPDHSVIRESVFGGRTPREDTRFAVVPVDVTTIRVEEQRVLSSFDELGLRKSLIPHDIDVDCRQPFIA